MINRYTELLNTFDKQPTELLASYFHDHAERIDSLIQLYEAYNRHVMNIQSKRIRELKHAINNSTPDTHWSDMEGLELVYEHSAPAATIRASFASTAKDPLGQFNIHISTPDMRSWNYYEDHIMSRYTCQEPVIMGDKTIVQVMSIPGQQTDRILSALEELCSFLSQLTVQTFLYPLTSN